MSGVDTADDTAKMKLLQEAEALAVKAQQAFQKFESFGPRVAALGRKQIDDAIEVGRHLTNAKGILIHGEFEEELKRWHINKTITFAPRSARRYMLLATYAEAIKSANLANMHEAEKYIAGLKHPLETQGSPGNDSTPLSKRKEVDPVEQCEANVLSNMHRLDPDKQRPFLEALITKLNERLQSLAS